MRLATIRTENGTSAVRVDANRAVETGYGDIGVLLAQPEWIAIAANATGRPHELDALDYAPLVPRPGKVICVGVNYKAHIEEMGREVPSHPTLFAKYPEALIGARDDIILPGASNAVDWEAELAVVIGYRVRNADEAAAEAAIAGYTIINDVSARDWQYRTMQWLQGKTFESTCPLGPYLVTPDEAGSGLELRCFVDGEPVQKANTADLVFGPVATIAYISTILTLNPGDVIALGTPGGVGHTAKPAALSPRRCGPDDRYIWARRVRQHCKSGDYCDIDGCDKRDGPDGKDRSVSRPASLVWWEQGEILFAKVAAGIADSNLDGPTLLPGWQRRTVIGHIARNADALCNLLRWASTDEESPMYPSLDARDRAIADTARLGRVDLLADYRSATERLSEAMHSLPDRSWSAQVRNARGRSIPASEIPWMRCKEVWLHAVDLKSGAHFSDLPDEVLAALIDDITGTWERRGDIPSIRICAGGRTWGDGTTTVAGGLPQMVGWLTGRLGDSELQVDGPLDDLPAWL